MRETQFPFCVRPRGRERPSPCCPYLCRTSPPSPFWARCISKCTVSIGGYVKFPAPLCTHGPLCQVPLRERLFQQKKRKEKKRSGLSCLYLGQMFCAFVGERRGSTEMVPPSWGKKNMSVTWGRGYGRQGPFTVYISSWVMAVRVYVGGQAGA